MIATDAGFGSRDMGHLPVRLENINQWVGGMTIPMYHIRNDTGCMNHTMHDTTGPMMMVSGNFPYQQERMAQRLENQVPQAALNSGRG